MMTADKLEDLAFNGEPMPEGLNEAEQMLFQSFRYLYRYARLTQMPPEKGREEKAELLREFEKRSFQIKRMEKTDKMWKDIEAAANLFGRERTIENAEAFVKAVYGVSCLPVQELRKRKAP